MNKIIFIAYLTVAVLLFSSFDVQKRAEALQKAYEEKDYDAFIDAFPDKYEDFVNIYGYDSKELHILYFFSNDHLEFLFSNDRIIETKVLDKLLSLSNDYVWQADAVSFVIIETRQLLLEHPKRITEYLSGKSDAEVISFFQMALTCLLPEDKDYLSEYHKLYDVYTPYPDRIVRLLKVAFERAKQASEVLIVY